MKTTIEKPKVFVSYAWGSDHYQNRVTKFASQLMSDGIEVVYDKWDLTEGNDTYHYMEKCVNDESITNVLILVDPIYTQKADSDKPSGVGTETQIISPQVYEKVTQDKFIPIVFERDTAGNICKPVYLRGRLHFDLSLEEKYDEEYFRLVKKLYGVSVYPKPELGSKPTWVDKTETLNIKKDLAFSSIKSIQPEKAKKRAYRQYLSDVLGGIIGDDKLTNQIGSVDDVLYFYDQYKSVRTEYNNLLEYSDYVQDSEEIIAKSLEDTALSIFEFSNVGGGLAKIFVHELFLYTVAHFLNREDYESAEAILGRPYYNPGKVNDKVSGFDIFYSGGCNSLDSAMIHRDGAKYISGTAKYWIDNIDINNCSKEQFLLADLICYNYSLFWEDELIGRPWFPMTYLYDSEYSSVLSNFGYKMVSKSFTKRIMVLFGFESVDAFQQKIKEISEKEKNGEYKMMRYPEVWHDPPRIDMFIEWDKVATVR